MRIAISGKSVWNTTVSSLVSKELGYPMINFTSETSPKSAGWISGTRRFGEG